jgi:site-specific DNA-methyltransferase (cytosine-N4-specific)
MLELNKIYCGNNLDLLKQLDDKSIQLCVTSPPYFSLRSYLSKDDPNKHLEIGAEESLQEYIDNLVKIFSEVYRVLRDDGILYLNLGDSYAANRTYQVASNKGANKGVAQSVEGKGSKVPAGLKPKDLIGVPWRVAFALQDWGWTVRSEIIWAKGISFNNKYSGSCMPESCKDRPTKSHETVFMLTKGTKYYYDNEAVAEETTNPYTLDCIKKAKEQKSTRSDLNIFSKEDRHGKGKKGISRAEMGALMSSKRNIRSVWTINPESFRGAHFAVMATKLIEPCILAGTSEYGCCFNCGKPYTRIIEKGRADEEHKRLCGADSNGEYLCEATKEFKKNNVQNASEVKARILAGMVEKKTVGWKKDCKCETDEIKPCVVIDPFGGAGSVGLVVKQLGRDYILFDLNPEYCEIAKNRIQEILL